MNPFIKSNRKLWLNSWRFHVSVRVRKGRERARVSKSAHEKGRWWHTQTKGKFTNAIQTKWEKNVQTPTGTRAHRSRHSRNRFSLPFAANKPARMGCHEAQKLMSMVSQSSPRALGLGRPTHTLINTKKYNMHFTKIQLKPLANILQVLMSYLEYICI